MPEVNRYNSGLAIQGERFRVTIQPSAYHFEFGAPGAALYIAVDARSSSWGDDWARVTGDIEVAARPQDVCVTQTAGGMQDVLQVLPPKHADLPEFRTGFTLALEPGMREPILAALPRVKRVTQLTAAVGHVVEPLLGRTRELDAHTALKWYEIAAIESIAAGIVLGEKPVNDAIKWSVLLPPEYTTWAFSEDGDHPHYAELGAVLRQPAVQAILVEAGRDLPA